MDRFAVNNPFKFMTADWYSDRNSIPMFSILELTTSSVCTRACSFCPRGVGWRDQSKNFLTLQNSKRLVRELQELQFSGNLILSGTGEPMSHPNWLELANILTNGPWKSQLITNGDFLHRSELVSMFDIVCVSLYDGEHQIEKFSKILDGLKYELRRRYNHEFLQLSNRAGMMPWKPREDMVDRPCNYPMYQLTVNHDGRTVMCCQDWSATNLGNVFEDGVWAVWTGEQMNSYRKILFKNRYITPCEKCDVTGTMSGKAHRQGWYQYLYPETEGTKLY